MSGLNVELRTTECKCGALYTTCTRALDLLPHCSPSVAVVLGPPRPPSALACDERHGARHGTLAQRLGPLATSALSLTKPRVVPWVPSPTPKPMFLQQRGQRGNIVLTGA